MDNFNIRITRRTEIDNRAHEQSIDIDFGKEREPVATAMSSDIRGAAPADEETHIAGDSDDMQQALTEISQELGCQNTLEDMLFAIDALRKTNVHPALEWSDTLCAGERVNHAKAVKACAALGDGWRLPTRVELLSLVDDMRHEPAIDTDRFPDTKSGAYWTSTLCAWASSDAWIVVFSYGYAYFNLRDHYNAFVRAVRSVPAGQ